MFYAVLTTGIYCRPECRARPPLPENTRHFATSEEAQAAGYRACRRCRPDLPPQAEREAALVIAACRMIAQAETPPALATLAAEAGLSPGAFHRLFRRVAGCTPLAYAAQARSVRVQAALAGSGRVTEAIYDAGFAAPSRFYEGHRLGMTPTAWRDGGRGEVMQVATGASSLGTVLVAATARGVCAILLGDDARALQLDLAMRFPNASCSPAREGFAATLAAVLRLIDDPRVGLDLPLDIRGTAFQCRVWQALRALAPGRTVSYAALAAELGVAGGARAVAGACAANRLAVAVPCHRVVRGDGDLAGYAWGVDRKRALLEKEK